MHSLGTAGELATKKLQAGFERAKKSASALASKLGGLRGALLSVGVAALTKRIIGQAAAAAQTQVRLKALSKEYGEFERIQKLVASNAKTFNQSQAESAENFSDVYARLRPLGISLEKIQTVYAGFNATALASGTSAAAASGAFLQLSQALGSGRLQGDEFRSIAEQVPGILRLVAAEMNVTVSELKELGSEGKITSDILINALAKGFDENKGKIKALLAESPAQKFKEFSNATSELSNSIGTELLPAVTPLVSKATELVKLFGDLPAPVKTTTAGILGLSAAAAIAIGPLTNLAQLIKIIGVAKILALGPWAAAAAGLVALTVAAVDGTKKSREYNDVITMKAKNLEELDAQADKANEMIKKLTPTVAKAGHAGRVAAKKMAELRDVLEEIKERRKVMEQVFTIAGIKYDANMVPIDPPETVSERLEREEKERQKRLKEKTKTGKFQLSPLPAFSQQGKDPALLAEEAFAAQTMQIAKGNELLQERLAGTEEEYLQREAINQIIERAGFTDTQRIQSARDFLKVLFDQKNELEEQVKKQKELQEAQRAAAEDLDQLYKSIGNSITTGVVDSLTAAVEGTKSLAEVATNTLRSIGQTLLRFGFDTLFSSLVPGGGILDKIFGGGRAAGGSVKKGTSYLVGERGPELFTPGRSGSIAPNNAIGGANVTVNVDASGSSVQGDGQNAAQLGRAIGLAVQTELRKQQRPGGILAR